MAKRKPAPPPICPRQQRRDITTGCLASVVAVVLLFIAALILIG